MTMDVAAYHGCYCRAREPSVLVYVSSRVCCNCKSIQARNPLNRPFLVRSQVCTGIQERKGFELQVATEPAPNLDSKSNSN
jgi:hypothetical protein